MKYVTSNVSVQLTGGSFAGGFSSDVCQVGTTIQITNCYSEAFVHSSTKYSGGFLGVIQSSASLDIQYGLYLIFFLFFCKKFDYFDKTSFSMKLSLYKHSFEWN